MIAGFPFFTYQDPTLTRVHHSVNLITDDPNVPDGRAEKLVVEAQTAIQGKPGVMFLDLAPDGKHFNADVLLKVLQGDLFVWQGEFDVQSKQLLNSQWSSGFQEAFPIKRESPDKEALQTRFIRDFQRLILTYRNQLVHAKANYERMSKMKVKTPGTFSSVCIGSKQSSVMTPPVSIRFQAIQDHHLGTFASYKYDLAPLPKGLSRWSHDYSLKQYNAYANCVGSADTSFEGRPYRLSLHLSKEGDTFLASFTKTAASDKRIATANIDACQTQVESLESNDWEATLDLSGKRVDSRCGSSVIQDYEPILLNEAKELITTYGGLMQEQRRVVLNDFSRLLDNQVERQINSSEPSLLTFIWSWLTRW